MGRNFRVDLGLGITTKVTVYLWLIKICFCNVYLMWIMTVVYIITWVNTQPYPIIYVIDINVHVYSNS